MRTVRRIQPLMSPPKTKIKVAAYARVSDSRLHHSLSTQVSYYSRLIQSHPDWELVGVYYDEGISGKEQTNRQGFQDLIRLCGEGKVDRILTKSIARFGRNTVELLTTVRQLRLKNIGVTFEKEGIDSLSSDGELMLSLLASVAQEESQNISQNVKWRIKKNFEQGIPHTPQDMYGYRWNGVNYVIEPTEAEVIRQVFDWYLKGDTVPDITNKLNEKGVLTRLGNPFTVASIREFFKQEAYFGRLVLQKTYRADFSRNPKRNKGQRTKYIVENAHEPIVSKAYFDKVIEEKNRRYRLRNQETHLHKGICRERIRCHHCGQLMMTRVDSKKVNRTVRYCCRTRDRHGPKSCPSKTLGEKRLLATFESMLGFLPDAEWMDENIKELVFDSLDYILFVTLKKGKSYTLKIMEGRIL
ncbi:recombinase family protein [Streptococcus iniae]|uniref:recombinase family protein n=1 Tax=Streptococcus iniae TaxID=1346 RepID=UPI000EFCA699|nr:recombinase family protein [Streptococcus iniae]ELY5747895.1 recombinase family protein [Streptococcus iniae]RMI73802.1 recombinase family protein [Streptococcus iniae]